MSRIVLFVFLIFVSIFSHANKVNIPGTSVVFDVPDDFKPLTQEEINIKWVRRNPPKWALGNENASTTIAYEYRGNDISKIEMPTLIKYMKDNMSRVVPGVEWKKSEVIDISGQKWVSRNDIFCIGYRYPQYYFDYKLQKWHGYF
ncbi:hypothetical protein [Photobacterium sp. 1_MG-2023]|uniref:hypothetical protein n=1 Tax=Photobacterium sp. 1_MG-2023 TaxID=3062646 RepID=UPI0026E2BC93|nr:hypothetical protein [Photobacterium sp. 1_MG-2023]MDO6708828.1 hypothetical protein [Photobacterium sp. 1_MG-2023]